MQLNSHTLQGGRAEKANKHDSRVDQDMKELNVNIGRLAQPNLSK